jgi:hypothetical protein
MDGPRVARTFDSWPGVVAGAWRVVAGRDGAWRVVTPMSAPEKQKQRTIPSTLGSEPQEWPHERPQDRPGSVTFLIVLGLGAITQYTKHRVFMNQESVSPPPSA